MRKIITAILAITLALTMAIPMSAADQNSDTSRKRYEEHTVVWSEAEGGKITLITTTEYDELPTADQISPAFRFEINATGSITQLLSDETEKGEEALALAMSGKRIPAGTVIRVDYGGGIDDSYPAQIGTPAKVIFCGTRTGILLSQVTPIIDMLNSISENDKYSISPEESENFDIVTYFTVVGSTYNEKTKRCDLAISMKEKHFSVAENKDLWYYTTANISVDVSAEEGSGIDVSNDGTKKGKQEWDNLFNRNGYVTYGTVIELRWNGMIMETYPPKLCGIRRVTFTGKQTDYSREEIDQERNEMNAMFLDENHYPDEANPISDSKTDSDSKADTNPATGTENVFAGAALIGVLAWVVSVAGMKGKNR